MYSVRLYNMRNVWSTIIFKYFLSIENYHCYMDDVVHYYIMYNTIIIFTHKHAQLLTQKIDSSRIQILK